MTATDARLRALETDVRGLAEHLAVVVRGLRKDYARELGEDFERSVRALAARLAEPRGETLISPAAAGALYDATQSVAPPDEPSEDDLRVLGLEINRIERWPPHYRARFAWRWCRERMGRTSPPATVEHIAGIIRDKRVGWRLPNNESCTQDTAREIAALYAVPDVPAEIVRALEQAHDCISGETPEDCTHEQAREATLDRIRNALAVCAQPARRKAGEVA